MLATLLVPWRASTASESRLRRGAPCAGPGSVDVANAVHPHGVGSPGPSWWGTGDDHDPVTGSAPPGLLERLVDLLHHLVGGGHGRDDEGLDPPAPNWLRTTGSGVNARMGTAGRCRARRRAVAPVWVKATRAHASRSRATSTAAASGAALLVRSGASIGGSCPTALVSAASMRVTTAWYGLAPTVVSADSMSASAPSNTAAATSEASAHVGAGG